MDYVVVAEEVERRERRKRKSIRYETIINTWPREEIFRA